MNKLLNIDQIKELIDTHKMMLLLIASNHCGVCDAVLVKLEKLLKNFPMIAGGYAVIDEVPAASGEYLVFTAPTILLFIEGKEVLRESRFIQFSQLEKDLNQWSENLDRI